ncbi:TfoX/Sxy family DNA transformation protein [Paenibacillus sp. GD4]|uniref:TfoX/Sxy family DNA transformation protein n=1 Tax=Paenibacillus sp. GD4 TaxID=3068890 RepID=UPI00279691FD|nr:TfoX/Sxy family DNA transformation protein [Paenibacillus sp. GD4]MDQ1911492.1 TfoX/Sxy family DNA transformation protein [Paenibacillus sp. GD4]
MGIRNIGPKTEDWLREVGIQAYEDLAKWGSVEVYRRLKEHRAGKISLNALYALEAALWDLHWLELPMDIKEKVRREAEEA